MAIAEESLELLHPPDQAAVATRPDVADLYEDHGPELVLLCRRILGPGGDAEDAAHETILKAWSALDRFDPNRAVWPWLATIARRTCIDQQRRRATARAHTPLSAPEPSGPEELVVAGAHGPLVRDALQGLSTPAREVLYLRDVQGWDYARIGAHQRRSARAVRMAVSRARHDLRARVEEMARNRGQWPLAGLSGGLLPRIRLRAARIRASASRASARAGGRLDATLDGLASALPATLAQATIGAVVLYGASTAPLGTAPAPAPEVSQTIALVQDAPVATAATRPGGSAIRQPAAQPAPFPVTSTPEAPAAVAIPEPSLALAPAAPSSLPDRMPEVTVPSVPLDPDLPDAPPLP